MGGSAVERGGQFWQGANLDVPLGKPCCDWPLPHYHGSRSERHNGAREHENKKLSILFMQFGSPIDTATLNFLPKTQRHAKVYVVM